MEEVHITGHIKHLLVNEATLLRLRLAAYIAIGYVIIILRRFQRNL